MYALRILFSFLLICVLAVPAMAAGVRIETTLGDIVLRLDEEKAPNTTKNFLDYVKSGFYNNTVFHRVISGFMIQGGGFTEDLQQKITNAPIKNEAANGLPNDKYTIAMARTNDPHSASAQFFINTKDNTFLNYKAPTVQGWGYAVFGKVIQGQDIVDKIEKVATGSVQGYDDVPLQPVVITRATIIE